MAQWLFGLEGLWENCRGWAAGVAWGRGGRVWLVTGVVEEDLSFPVPRVEANAITPSSMWLLFGHIWWLLWLLDSGLDSGVVRALLLWRRAFRRLWLGLGFGLCQCAGGVPLSQRGTSSRSAPM